MKRLQTITAFGFVGFSLSLFVLVAAFEGGLKVTPYGTMDSRGFIFGFNNRITPELYGIILKNTSFAAAAKAIGSHGIVCFLMHLAGLVILFANRGRLISPIREWFFLLQVLLFPFAWLGMLFAPSLAYAFLTGQADGETFTDGPPVWWTAQGTWIITAIMIFLISRVAYRRNSFIRRWMSARLSLTD